MEADAGEGPDDLNRQIHPMFSNKYILYNNKYITLYDKYIILHIYHN